jgi:hypothetical protein
MTKYLRHAGIRFELSNNAFLNVQQANYSLRRLWQLVAGSAEWRSDLCITFVSHSISQVEAMFRLAPGRMLSADLTSMLPSGCSLPIDVDRLPALCADDGPLCFTDRNKTFPLDLVTAAFLLLSRWEETRGMPLDAWGNPVEGEQLAVKQGFHERPLLDEWALVVRSWLVQIDPGWTARPSGPRVWLTHDVDFFSYHTGIRSVAGAAIRGVAQNRSLTTGLRNACAGLATLTGLVKDPCIAGTLALRQLARKHGIKATWFLMSSDAQRHKLDTGYDAAAFAESFLLDSSPATEIMWHPGYVAAEDSERFDAENRRFKELFGHSPVGVRYHYLRCRPLKSWQQLADHGVAYDSTMGFNTLVGFRSSTAHDYPMWDHASQAELPLSERPMIIMDGPLFASSGFHPARAVELTERLWRRCQAVSGVLTLNIHNTHTMTAPGLVSALTAWFGTLPASACDGSFNYAHEAS